MRQLFWLCVMVFSGLFLAPAQTFTNPIFANSADPSWIYVSSTGLYYAVRSGCGQTGGVQAICMRTAASIPALATATWTAIYTAPATGANATNLWAPQIRYFSGLSQPWSIYYSAVSSTAPSDDHRLFALTPIAGDPINGLNSWQPAATGNASGQINPGWVNSNWAIDPDVCQASDNNYYILFRAGRITMRAWTRVGINQSALGRCPLRC